MKYMNKSLEELHELLKNKEVTSKELIEESLKLSHEVQEKYNAFVTILDDAKETEVTDNILSGIPCGIKDNYSTRGVLSTGSSNTLKDYVPFFDATAYSNLKKAGAVMVNKTVMDEFGMGGTGTTGHTGIVLNPWDKTRMCAGSSAGSACAVAAGVYPYATGSDTGDSIRKPAAYCGIVGYKPTYGMISRYGLFAFASSLDTVGVIARSTRDVSYVMDIIKGHDDKDMTSLPDDNILYSDNIDNDIKGKKLFYIKEALENKSGNKELNEIIDNFYKTIDKAREIGFIVDEVSIDKELLETIYPAYNVISCAEATSNNSNLTGISFGNRIDGKDINDIMMKTRTEGFSELIKRRFVIGSYVLQKENQEKLFLNACRVRRLIVNKFNELFKEYDGYILPSTERIAPRFNEASDKLGDDYLILGNHLIIGNFGGYPSISIPCGFVNNMPIGVTITGRAKEDYLVLNMANKLEEVLGYIGQVSKSE